MTDLCLGHKLTWYCLIMSCVTNSPVFTYEEGINSDVDATKCLQVSRGRFVRPKLAGVWQHGTARGLDLVPRELHFSKRVDYSLGARNKPCLGAGVRTVPFLVSAVSSQQ